MRRNVIRNVIHTKSISLVIRFGHTGVNVVLAKTTASATVPTVLVSCGIYSSELIFMSLCSVHLAAMSTE